MTKKFDYITIRPETAEFSGEPYFLAIGWDKYGRGSVLEGQPRVNRLDTFDTLEEAQAAYPGAEVVGKFGEPQVCLSHLPGEDDPVAGGMYPDDY